MNPLTVESFRLKRKKTATLTVEYYSRQKPEDDETQFKYLLEKGWPPKIPIMSFGGVSDVKLETFSEGKQVVKLKREITQLKRRLRLTC